MLPAESFATGFSGIFFSFSQYFYEIRSVIIIISPNNNNEPHLLEETGAWSC